MRKLCLLLALLLALSGCAAKEEAAGASLSELVDPPETEPNIRIVEAESHPAPETMPSVGEAAPEEPVAPEEPALPEVDLDGWELLLANAEHSIGEYAPQLSEVEGMQVDERIAGPLTDFIAAARAEGLSVYLSSAYRDYNEQSYLYNRKVEQYGGDQEAAAAIVAPPGTSEHQTGLACDITDQYYELKTHDLENTALYQWMQEHCQEYGFIVRYPKDKEDVTGIIYEPWHFRYVGKEAAVYIMDHDLCLEEFLALYE